jgi:hypothetical protein
MRAEIADRRGRDLEPLGTQEGSLQFEVSTITAQFARRCDHSMTRKIRPAAVPHDVADRSRGTGPASGFRDVTIRGDVANGNPADDGQDVMFES